MAKLSPAESIWLSLMEANNKLKAAENVTQADPAKKAYKKWLIGMAKSMQARFPDRLRKQREKQGLTQKELAEWADITPNAVALIERGERQPSLDTAARLCWALDMAALNQKTESKLADE